MLSLEACRELLGDEAPADERELEARREHAYRLARLLIEIYRDQKALDYRLLRALAFWATGGGANGPGDPLEAQVFREYLDERINLGKAAELLQLSQFELEASFQRLGIPLRRGARSIEDAQAEIAVARLNSSSGPHTVPHRHDGPE